jgi:hypothetical protein
MRLKTYVMQKYKGNTLLYFHGNAFSIYGIVDSDMYVNNTKGTHYYASMATTVTRTRQNVIRYMHYVSCY